MSEPFRLEDICKECDIYVYEQQEQFALGQCEIVESAGLKDKNGTEVFEHDIYRNLDNGNIGRFSYLQDGGGYTLWCTEFKENGDLSTHRAFRDLDTTNFEVLGNIYENPELLANQ